MTYLDVLHACLESDSADTTFLKEKVQPLLSAELKATYYTRRLPVDNTIQWINPQVVVCPFPDANLDQDDKLHMAKDVFTKWYPQGTFYPPKPVADDE